MTEPSNTAEAGSGTAASAAVNDALSTNAYPFATGETLKVRWVASIGATKDVWNKSQTEALVGVAEKIRLPKDEAEVETPTSIVPNGLPLSPAP